MAPPVTLGPFDFGRVVNAAQKVEQRLLRSTAALEEAGVPYAVIGGNAVANWVSRVDESLVRFTRNVDILLRREDLAAAEHALAAAGFVRLHVAGIEVFLDGPDAKAGDAVHVLFSGEKVREEYVVPTPDVHEVDLASQYRVLSLEALVRMKLTSFRKKDQVHLEDMIDAQLIDATWVGRFTEELSRRLRQVFDEREPPLHGIGNK